MTGEDAQERSAVPSEGVPGPLDAPAQPDISAASSGGAPGDAAQSSPAASSPGDLAETELVPDSGASAGGRRPAAGGPATPEDAPSTGEDEPSAREAAPSAMQVAASAEEDQPSAREVAPLTGEDGAPAPAPSAVQDRAAGQLETEQPPLEAVLEAVLLVTDEPVPAVTLAQVAERPTEEVEASLRRLAAEYGEQSRGFTLRAVAGGWRLYTRDDCAPYVERFVLDGQQARLTQAALETLAVIAYRQPVTRSRVSAVRGVNVDGVVRTLVSRGLVTEVGTDPESGATLYGTTALLLEKLGLVSLNELPSLAPLLPELEDMHEGSMST